VIEAKRVKELEKEVNKCVGGFDSEFNGIVAWIDLLEFFKDYAALKAENERLRREDSRSCDYRAAWGMCDRLDEVYELKTLAEKAEAENAHLRDDWFKKGRASVLTTNRSGCCCEIDEQDNIVSMCSLHREIVNKAEAEFGELRTKLDGAELVREKVEAELIETNKEFWKSRATIDGLKAQLAKQAPLIEAVMRPRGKEDWAFEVNSAAISYREKKGAGK